MRVTSLIIFLAIAGGVAFCFVHKPTRDWIFTKTKDVAHQADGFPLAKTPREAVDLFSRAVNERKYAAAARYCSEDYAKLLEKADSAGYNTGTALDKIYNQLDNKDMLNPMVVELILNMDPFPRTFKLKADSLKETKNGELAEFVFEVEPKSLPQKGRKLSQEENKTIDRKMDKKMYQAYPLVPKVIYKKHEIKFDKKNEAWKIVFEPRTAECDYFLENHKRYLEAYYKYHEEVVKERKLADEVGPDLLGMLLSSTVR